MTKSANNTKGLLGPFGLRIGSSQFNATTYKPGTTWTAKPSYAPNGVKLGDVKKRADKVSLYLGGLLSSVAGADVPVATSTQAWAFDTVPVDNGIDSFYLSDLTFTAPPSITVLGVTADNVKIVAKELSNHPDLLKAKGLAAGQWVGSINLSGSKLSFPAIAGLSVTPKSSGTDAFSGRYDLATGDVDLDLSKLSYTSPQLGVTLSDSSLKLSNNNKDWSLKGQGELSLPGLGLEKLTGSLDVKVVNAALQSLKASIASSTPIGSLGLSGSFSVDHNFSTNTGTLALTKATIAGIDVDGTLSYANAGIPATDGITGQLTFDNTVARKDIDFDLLDLSLVPLSGTINYQYSPVGSSKPGGYLNFTNTNIDLVTGVAAPDMKIISLNGNMTLKLDANGKASLDALDLTLLNPPLTTQLGEGTLKLEPAAADKPVRFSMQRGTTEQGESTDLVPTFSGKLSYSNDGISAFASVDGFAYLMDTTVEPAQGVWMVINPQIGLDVNGL